MIPPTKEMQWVSGSLWQLGHVYRHFEFEEDGHLQASWGWSRLSWTSINWQDLVRH